MKRAAISLAVLAMLGACGDKGGENGGAAGDSTATAAAPAPVDSGAGGAAPAQGALTDPQIAHIAVTANQVDIDAGQQAKGKATNPKVKEFAERMITDHTAVNKEAGELAQRLNVTPEDNPTSQQLKQGGDQSRQQLEGTSGAAYDKAYIEHEVAYHQQVLDALDQQLIPGAQNADLKALLQKVRPAVQAHLDMAKQIQGTLQ